MDSKVKILIVDDIPENLLALEAVLESMNYQLISVKSGEEALRCLLKDDFAVILLDVQMPGIDGFETARIIRSRQKSKYTPIIFITAVHQDSENVHKGYSLGAIDYIFKPIDPESLKFKIAGFVHLYQYREQLEQIVEQRTKDLIASNHRLLKEIEERQQIENQMARLDRLNIVGEMAAGISHEVRNPMTTVRGFLQVLREKEEYDKDKAYFNLMIDELDRANSIITEFLSIGNNKPSAVKVQNINQIIETLAPLMQADALRSNNYVEVNFGKIPDVPINDKEIRQVILNLVRNGMEAMPQGGKVTISTYLEQDNVVLSIADQGSGIEKEVLKNIGTPFFTTKENGTGLGLVTCLNICNRHKAKVDIHTDSTDRKSVV